MPTELRLLILGLLARKPRTPYALGRALAEMPATGFSGSPGAIYPAVRAMEEEGLVARARSTRNARGHPYVVTAAGRRVLRGWLSGPVWGWDLLRSPGTVLLRLSFLERKDERARFKRQVGRSAQAALAHVQAYTAAADSELAESSRHAFELTAAILAAYAQWAGVRVRPRDRKVA